MPLFRCWRMPVIRWLGKVGWKIQVALRSLTDRQRLILERRYFNDDPTLRDKQKTRSRHSHKWANASCRLEDIASELGLSVVTVQRDETSALEKLRELLPNELKEGFDARARVPRPPAREYSTAPFAERFWAKVEKSDGCWIWTGGETFRVADGSVKRPRVVAWELQNGPIPEGARVSQSCGNRLCVRRDHLLCTRVAQTGEPVRKTA